MIYLNRIRIPIERVFALKLQDRYDMHKLVCNFFPQGTEHSFYVHPVIDSNGKVLVIDSFATEPANAHDIGFVETKKVSDSFLNHRQFKFMVELNPTKKIDGKRKSLFAQNEVLTQSEKDARLVNWAIRQFAKSGCVLTSIEFGAYTIEVNKRSGRVIISNATGFLKVTDSELFKQSIIKGIGPSTFLGIGMLRLFPV